MSNTASVPYSDLLQSWGFKPTVFDADRGTERDKINYCNGIS